ncbi:hypothetical protein [Ekhidna sp.]
MKNILSIFVLFILIISCDPCDDCDSVTFEPTVSFIFINQDSIEAINDSLSVIAEIDSSLSTNIDSLILLKDSLQILEDSIANGGMLDQQKIDIETLIGSRQADSLLFAMKNAGTDTIIPILNSTVASINSGLILVSEIAIPGTGYSEVYEDSALVWSIPLSFDNAFAEYNVTIDGFTETIELLYDNVQTVDEQRNVLIRAENIEVINKTYLEIDSVKSNCTENCVDGEATFTFYF